MSKLKKGSPEETFIRLKNDPTIQDALKKHFPDGVPILKTKYYLTFLEAGEFGPKPLWGIFVDREIKGSVSNWVAFYNSKEEALKVYPEAVQV